MKAPWTAAAIFLLIGTGEAATMACRPQLTQVIQAEGLCLDVGVSVGYQNGGSSKVICLESNSLRNACGQDGGLARTHAFSDWLNKVKDFEGLCASQGGTFSYANRGFEEPQDATFCGGGEPLATTNMLEDTLCNYRSNCPATPVVCDFPCRS